MKNGQINLYNGTTKCPFCSTRTINLNANKVQKRISKEEETKSRGQRSSPYFSLLSHLPSKPRDWMLDERSRFDSVLAFSILN